MPVSTAYIRQFFNSVLFILQSSAFIGWFVFLRLRPTYTLLIGSLHDVQPAQDVIEVGNNHQQDEDAKANVFGLDHEVL